MSKVLKSFIDYKPTWWLILDCGHWYHWTGKEAPGVQLDCPSCKVVRVAKDKS